MTFHTTNLFTQTLKEMNVIGAEKNILQSQWKGRSVSGVLSSGVKIIASSVKLVVSAVFESLTYPVRYIYHKYQFNQQISADINMIPQEKRDDVRQTIEGIIDDEGVNITGRAKEQCVRKAMATYASTQAYYSPVVHDWAQSLLRSAARSGRTLIFLARDGIAPYEVAKRLKDKHPEFKDVTISLKFLSRKVINNATNREWGSNARN